MNRLLSRHFAAALVALGFIALLAAGCRTLNPAGAGDRAAQAREERELQGRVSAHAHYASGIVQELAGDAAAAREEFYLAAKADPADAALLMDVSGRLIEGRAFARALEVLTWARALPEVDALVFVRLGFVHAELGQNEKAIEANEIAVRRLPDFLPARQNLFLSQVQARRPDRALAVLDEAANRPDEDADALINLAELYASWGRHFPEQRELARARAIGALDRAAAARPVPASSQLKLADGFLLLGATDKATQWYLNFLANDQPTLPLRDLVRAKLADIFLQASDRTRAAEQLTALVRENPANAGAHYFLGALALADKRWADAEAEFQRALQLNPDFAPARLDLAQAQIANGRSAAALVTLTPLQAKPAAGFAVEYLLGLAYHEQKQFDQALIHLRAAESNAAAGETNRLNTAFYFQLGATSERCGDRAAAARYFEKSIALAPDNAEALNYLGYMWAEQGENLPRARELIERALKLEPDNDAYLDSMGWVLFKSGNVHRALEFLSKAVAKLEQPDATVYDHLGDVYAALKEMDKAREAWAKSISIEASETVQKKIDAVKDP